MWLIIFLLPLASCILPIIMFLTDPENKKWPVIPPEMTKKLLEQALTRKDDNNDTGRY